MTVCCTPTAQVGIPNSSIFIQLDWHKVRFIMFSPTQPIVLNLLLQTLAVVIVLTIDYRKWWQHSLGLASMPSCSPQWTNSAFNCGVSNASSFVPITLGQHVVAGACAPSVTIDFTTQSLAAGSNHSSHSLSRETTPTGLLFLSASSTSALPSNQSSFADSITSVTDDTVMKKIGTCTSTSGMEKGAFAYMGQMSTLLSFLSFSLCLTLSAPVKANWSGERDTRICWVFMRR